MWTKEFRINIFETVFMNKTFGTFLWMQCNERRNKTLNKQPLRLQWIRGKLPVESHDFFYRSFQIKRKRKKERKEKKLHEKWNSPKLATVLNPRYITRISWRVNFVNRHKSSKATGIGFGVRADGSNSNRTTSSSIGLSGGVAMLHHSQLSLVHFVFATEKNILFFSPIIVDLFSLFQVMFVGKLTIHISVSV